jgi:hypothetical protein
LHKPQPVNHASEFRYVHVEAALAQVLSVPSEKRLAFAARIRHLRNIGIPRGLSKPGSGQKIGYHGWQVMHVLTCLLLELHGHSPASASKWVDSFIEKFEQKPDREASEYLVIMSNKGRYPNKRLRIATDDLDKVVANIGDAHALTVVTFRQLVGKMYAALVAASK